MESDTGKDYGEKHSYSELRGDLLMRAMIGPVEERQSIVKLMLMGDPFLPKLIVNDLLNSSEEFVQALREAAYHTIRSMEELNRPQFIKLDDDGAFAGLCVL
jgi:hypothetical protein